MSIFEQFPADLALSTTKLVNPNDKLQKKMHLQIENYNQYNLFVSKLNQIYEPRKIDTNKPDSFLKPKMLSSGLQNNADFVLKPFVPQQKLKLQLKEFKSYKAKTIYSINLLSKQTIKYFSIKQLNDNLHFPQQQVLQKYFNKMKILLQAQISKKKLLEKYVFVQEAQFYKKLAFNSIKILFIFNQKIRNYAHNITYQLEFQLLKRTLIQMRMIVQKRQKSIQKYKEQQQKIKTKPPMPTKRKEIPKLHNSMQTTQSVVKNSILGVTEVKRIYDNSVKLQSTSNLAYNNTVLEKSPKKKRIAASFTESTLKSQDQSMFLNSIKLQETVPQSFLGTKSTDFEAEAQSISEQLLKSSFYSLKFTENLERAINKKKPNQQFKQALLINYQEQYVREYRTVIPPVKSDIMQFSLDYYILNIQQKAMYFLQKQLAFKQIENQAVIKQQKKVKKLVIKQFIIKYRKLSKSYQQSSSLQYQHIIRQSLNAMRNYRDQIKQFTKECKKTVKRSVFKEIYFKYLDLCQTQQNVTNIDVRCTKNQFMVTFLTGYNQKLIQQQLDMEEKERLMEQTLVRKIKNDALLKVINNTSVHSYKFLLSYEKYFSSKQYLRLVFTEFKKQLKIDKFMKLLAQSENFKNNLLRKVSFLKMAQKYKTILKCERKTKAKVLKNKYSSVLKHIQNKNTYLNNKATEVQDNQLQVYNANAFRTQQYIFQIFVNQLDLTSTRAAINNHLTILKQHSIRNFIYQGKNILEKQYIIETKRSNKLLQNSLRMWMQCRIYSLVEQNAIKRGDKVFIKHYLNIWTQYVQRQKYISYISKVAFQHYVKMMPRFLSNEYHGIIDYRHMLLSTKMIQRQAKALCTHVQIYKMDDFKQKMLVEEFKLMLKSFMVWKLKMEKAKNIK
ncbi:Hypothetical_protein [Hexamita inflata]|uniref:Hypothetical_protein n=1 Tax=Hexamita inflata TaxID=28002 RepID=A0AA86NM59_9EUKA|nr:Hypothetical protein HINF_LOCUS9379 [Hexamita inflata]